MFDYSSKKFRKTVEYKPKSRTWNQRKSIILDYLKTHNKSGRVLELGCGEVPIFEDSTTVDIVKLPNINIVHDLNNPIPLNEKFDTIITLELIGHLWNVDNFLKECNRLLKNDGVFFVSSLNVKHWKTRLQLLMGNDIMFDDNGYYYWRFSPKSLKNKLGEHGFKVEVMKSIGRIPFPNLSGRFIYICTKEKDVM